MGLSVVYYGSVEMAGMAGIAGMASGNCMVVGKVPLGAILRIALSTQQNHFEPAILPSVRHEVEGLNRRTSNISGPRKMQCMCSRAHGAMNWLLAMSMMRRS